jgi:Zn-dependent protease
MQNPPLDTVKVSAAGPASNILLAIGFYMICSLALVFVPNTMIQSVFTICYYGFLINLILAMFNLLPIPPLDGSKILHYFLPKEYVKYFYQLERYGFLIILLLFIFTPFSSIFFGQIHQLTRALFFGLLQ